MAGQYGNYPILGVPVYPSSASFPTSAANGSLAIAGDTDTLYIYSTIAMAWAVIGGTSVPLGVGSYDSQPKSADGLVIASNLLYAQSADATHPGMVSTAAQTLAGNKTFTGSISASNLSGTNTGDVSLGTANGLGLVGQVLSLGLSSTSTTGALSSTDWNTFNNKQTSGNYITALTGDITATGPGSVSATLATVNSNVGSFGSASSVGSFTVNAKGLITAASSTSIQIAESQVTNLVSDLAGKQATGNYITALTGDATAAGPGSTALTLATVNSNVGSFGSASSVSSITVNAKGLITAASSTSIQIAESQVTNLVSDLAGKQATGNYITALTGDVTAAGPGSSAATLATVNGNVGSFTNANITVNAKGLITAASNGSGGSSTTGLLVAAHVDPNGFAWPNTNTSFAAFSANVASGPNVLDYSITTWGTAQTANSNLPQITINNLVAGYYKVTAMFAGLSTSGAYFGYAFNDGTTTTGKLSLGGTTSSSYPVNLQGVFQYNSTANVTFSIWGFVNAGTNEIDMGGTTTGSQLNWIIEKIG